MIITKVGVSFVMGSSAKALHKAQPSREAALRMAQRAGKGAARVETLRKENARLVSAATQPR